MPSVTLVVIVVLVGIALMPLCHLAMVRVLAWRGITMSRTRFGLTLVFDTTDSDGTPVRMLNVGGAFQSACYATDELCTELVCEYQRGEAQVVSELPRLRHAVVIGGGGFSFPKWLATHLAPVRVTTIEVDPQIIELARERFYLGKVERKFEGTGRFSVVCADGWEWLRGQEEPADLIVNEAFSGRRPLGPLGTEEGARLVHEHLSEGGTYMANVRCPLAGRGSRVLAETLDVFAAEFGHVWVVPERPEEPKVGGNNTFFASDCDLVAAGCVQLAGCEWHVGDKLEGLWHTAE